MINQSWVRLSLPYLITTNKYIVRYSWIKRSVLRHWFYAYLS
nr:MAG TPA: hypothetical protein [Caudoviricetes sp.]